MIEVMIDSIRISLVSQHRIVLLREVDSERQLPIWIGPCEADAITIELQDVKVARPLTQDLLKNVITELGGSVSHVLIKELNESVFHARLFITIEGEHEPREIDCRPSDAIALAVRAKVPIFISEEVMDAAGVEPEPGIQEASEDSAGEIVDDTDLDAFSDFLDTLDFDDFDGEGGQA
ncbi:MAG TPA: bifunctional nuclease family protein [Promineifilum sp.]|nr:bifunctional nuclease family protein [Promineifilum sp.]HNS39626.1 bifunctional nuclease family protein [Promineifilum sp.]